MTKDSQETSWTFDQEETSQAAYKRDDVGEWSQFCFRSCEVKMQTPEASALTICTFYMLDALDK